MGERKTMPLRYIKNPSTRVHCLLAVFLAAVTVFRMMYAGTINLVCDEAYYWMWSRFLSLGYYDPGTLLAFVIRFFTTIFGNTELGVRMGGIVFSLGTSVMLYALLLRFVRPVWALLTILLFNFTPGGVLMGTLMMHDSLMSFFWVTTVFCIVNALGITAVTTPEKQDLETTSPSKKCCASWWWYAAGLCAGLGLWSKDTMILIVPLTFLFLVSLKEYRHWLLRKEPYLAYVIMGAVFSPIVVWNAQHNGVTYRHIFGLGTRGEGLFNVNSLGEFLGSQVGLVSPFVWLGIALSWCVLAFVALRKKSSAAVFLLMFSLPVFLFFLVLSGWSKVEGNWSGFGYLVAMAGLAYVMERVWLHGKKFFVGSFYIVSLLFTVLLVSVMLYPKILYAVVPHLPYFREHAQRLLAVDRTQEVHGWDQLGAEAHAFRDAIAPHAFVFTLRYQTASEIAFYYPNKYIHCFPVARRMNQFDVWEDLQKLVGKDGVLIIEKPSDEQSIEILRTCFEDLEWQKNVDVFRRDVVTKPIRSYSIYLCKKFKGMKKTFSLY